VFWQVGSSATLGTGTALMGSIVALTSITLNTGASVGGRALARNGAVTLDDNDVTLCSGGPGGVGGPLIPAFTAAIPTLSAWAMVVMTVLLLLSARAALRRRAGARIR
jgi:Ice-binding-like/IPTL-CTERM motif